MWHEARRQERKIRGLMVDFKKRADRRREYYEKIKMDPTQFLRVYGRPYKINFDPAVAVAAESPQSMMPWQGDTSNMIDRFDVRAHLDLIPEAPKHSSVELSRDVEEEDSLCNYERYRTLVENDASGLTEEQCLNEIFIDEHFGPPEKKVDEEKKKSSDKKAAIGYIYEDSTPAKEKDDNEEDDSDDESSDTDVETADLDVAMDVDQLTPEQEVELNLFANQYGMKDQDFMKLLRKDKDEVEALKYAKQIEEEKAQFSGRKSRRERRAFKEKQLQGRRLSPPSYAARSSPKYEPYRRAGSSSRSRSKSPEVVGQVKFITSFGAESDDEGGLGAVQGPSLPPTHSVSKSDSSLVNDSHSDKFGHHSWKGRSRPSHLRERSSHSRSRTRSRSPRYLSNRRRSDSRISNRRERRSRSRSRSGRPWDPRDQDTRRGRFERERNSSSTYGRSRFNRAGSRSRSRSRGRRRSRSRSGPRTQSRTGSRNSRSRSSSRSKSRSSQSSRRTPSPQPQLPPVIKRYRRDSLSSKSSQSSDEDDKDSSKEKSAMESSSEVKNTTALSSSKNKCGPGSTLLGKGAGDSQGKLTPQERLKRKMQAQLNRQYKADKKAEIYKYTKLEQERMDREEELRNRTMEMRRREREKRHRELEEAESQRMLRKKRSGSSSDDSDRKGRRNRTSSGSLSPLNTARRKRSLSRSRSKSASSENAGLVNY